MPRLGTQALLLTSRDTDPAAPISTHPPPCSSTTKHHRTKISFHAKSGRITSRNCELSALYQSPGSPSASSAKATAGISRVNPKPPQGSLVCLVSSCGPKKLRKAHKASGLDFHYISFSKNSRSRAAAVITS